MSMALKRELQHCDTIYKGALKLFYLDNSSYHRNATNCPFLQPQYHLDAILIEKQFLKAKRKMGRNKGFFKRRRTTFKHGNSATIRRVQDCISNAEETEPVKYVRLDAEQQAMVENNPILPAAVAKHSASDKMVPTFKFLRPCRANPADVKPKLSKQQIQR
jgi:hypothetical protein